MHMTTRFRKAFTSVALALTLPLIALVSGAEASSRKTIHELMPPEAAGSAPTAHNLLGSQIKSYELGLTAATPVVEAIHQARFSNSKALSTLLPKKGSSATGAATIAQVNTTEPTTAQGFTVPVDETFAP